MLSLYGLLTVPTKTQEQQDRFVIKRKYLRFEQLEVFRPMPVSDALKDKIRSDSDKAKAMAKESGLDKVGQRVQTNHESKTNGV